MATAPAGPWPAMPVPVWRRSGGATIPPLADVLPQNVANVTLCNRKWQKQCGGTCTPAPFGEPPQRGLYGQPQGQPTTLAGPWHMGRSAMTATTCIRNAACIVAWDAANQRHAYLMGGDVAFTGDTLSYVGTHYDGAADDDDRRHRPDGDAGPDRPALAPEHRAVLSRRARGARRARHVHERPLRTLGRVAAGCGRRARPASRWRSARCCCPASPASPICPASTTAGSTSRRRAGCACSWHLPTPRRAGTWRTAGR